jgi:hypothetical protein
MTEQKKAEDMTIEELNQAFEEFFDLFGDPEDWD